MGRKPRKNGELEGEGEASLLKRFSFHSCNKKRRRGKTRTAFESAYKVNLLHFNFSAGFNQLLLGFFGFFLGHGFLQGGGSAVNLVLGFLQAEAGQSADNLDDADLVGAGGLQDDVEFGLSSAGAAASASGHHHGSGGSGSGHAELFFEFLDEFGEFEHGHVSDKFTTSSLVTAMDCSFETLAWVFNGLPRQPFSLRSP